MHSWFLEIFHPNSIKFVTNLSIKIFQVFRVEYQYLNVRKYPRRRNSKSCVNVDKKLFSSRYQVDLWAEKMTDLKNIFINALQVMFFFYMPGISPWGKID